MNGGALKLPRLISDGMVLQRNIAVKIRGWASVGETVTVEFIGKVYTAKTNDAGIWEIVLDPADAGGPWCMTVTAGDSITAGDSVTVNDILTGDVWVCSGQSNMLLPVNRVRDLYEEEIAVSRNNELRQYMVPERYDFKAPQDDLTGGSWISADPESVLNFAAVGYFFAAALHKKYDVPIGLINASVGGTPIEAWAGENVLKDFPHLLKELEKCKDDTYIEKIKTKDAEASEAWFGELDRLDDGMGNCGLPWYNEDTDVSEWHSMKLPALWADEGLKDFCGSVWFRKEIQISEDLTGLPALLRLGTIVDSDTVWINGIKAGATTYRYPPRKYQIPAGILKEGKNVIVVRAVSNTAEGEFIKDKLYRLEIAGTRIDLAGIWKYRIGAQMTYPLPDTTFIQYKPAGLFNGMIAPLLNHAVKGVLWYQGESNASNAAGYDKLLISLIRDWRKGWSLGSLPFCIVQLPNYLKAASQPVKSDWAELREAQQKALSLPDTAMAVTMDAGEWNDVHPLNKKAVGERLALAAQSIAYKEDILYLGPVYREMRIEENRIVLCFDNVGKGLAAGPEVSSGAAVACAMVVIPSISRIADGEGQLKHFAIAGADRKFVWAQAKIINDTVIVWNDQIADPAAVRYAWADNPEGANLHNRDGLLAPPFRTDDWN